MTTARLQTIDAESRSPGWRSEGPVPRSGRFDRRSLLAALGTGLAALAGCTTPAADPNDDAPAEPVGSLQVEVRSGIDAETHVQVALIEGDASFEESLVAAATLQLRNDLHGVSIPELSGGPFRIVVRTTGALEATTEATWDLERCVEFSLRVTVLEDRLALTTACQYRDPPHVGRIRS